MNFARLVSILTVVSFTLSVGAQSRPDEKRLRISQMITETPTTFLNVFRIGTQKNQLGKWGLVLGTTVPLLIYDEDIYNETQKIGRRWGLSTEDKLKPYMKITEDFALMWGPSDLSSGLYFLGDGWIHLSAASAFLAVGYFGDHTRPFNTAVELFNGFLCSTIFSQALKKSFGREAPAVRESPGGTWRHFPSWADYEREKTRHDAFPSGHVMTTTVTFTILRGNYPEWESWLWPTQLVYTAALGFGMVNNGIHWAGDYPLGIALGYFFGKAALQMARTGADESAEAAQATALLDPQLVPSFDALTGNPVASLRWDF